MAIPMEMVPIQVTAWSPLHLMLQLQLQQILDFFGIWMVPVMIPQVQMTLVIVVPMEALLLHFLIRPVMEVRRLVVMPSA